MEHIKIGNFLKELRNVNQFNEDVYRLVEEDLNFGLEKEQINLYLKKNFKLSKMKVLSECLRKGVDAKFLELVTTHHELTGYQIQLSLEFFQKGVGIETIEASINNKSTVQEMKQLYQSVLEKLNEAKAETEVAPTYVKKMMEQISASIEKIHFQEERYDELNKKLVILEQTKIEEEDKERMLQEYKNAEAIMDSQQSKLNQADSTIARLREQISDKEKEMKRMQSRIENLEDKLLDRVDRMESKTVEESMDKDSTNKSTTNKVVENEKTNVMTERIEDYSEDVFISHPQDVFTNRQQAIFKNNASVFYQIPVVDKRGKVIHKIEVERNKKKNERGISSLLEKLGFKKKSRQDIVKLLASGNLVPAQLVQIKAGIEKGLNDEQLVALINHNVSAEKMKEIIEIAVLENSMDD